MAGGNGFDDLFTAMASVNEEVVSLGAELVLLGERVTMLEEARGGTGDASSAGGAGNAGGTGKEPGEEPGEEGGRAVGAPVCWDDLGAEERAALWPGFVAWVLRVADRYEVTNDQLPRQCWWLHGAVVEELTALWTSHQSAYAAGEDAGSAPYLWQDALARAIERIGRMWVGTCRNGAHRDRHRERWAGDDPYLKTILAAGATGRNRGGAPGLPPNAPPSGGPLGASPQVTDGDDTQPNS